MADMILLFFIAGVVLEINGCRDELCLELGSRSLMSFVTRYWCNEFESLQGLGGIIFFHGIGEMVWLYGLEVITSS